MISNRRQALPLVIVMLMVVSVFAFTPASAEASVTATLEGFHGSYSFASVNGSADYTVTITNDGDVDFEMVTISASFMDDTWKAEDVTFTSGGNEENGTMGLGSLASSAMIQVQVQVLVDEEAKVDFAEVPMSLEIDADGTSFDLEAIVCVTNWIAYESNFPDQPAVNTYDMGDSNDYQITVENIAVDVNEVPKDINDVIVIQFSGISGWSVTSDDEGWHPFYGGTLEGMDASEKHTWNVKLELTGDVRAGDHNVDFQAQSTNPDDPFGMPYIQPYGMTVIPVVVAEWYGVSVSGASSQNVDLSEGSSIVTWTVGVNNLGNTGDSFDITWDNSGVSAGWTLSSQPDTSGEVAWKGTSSFDMSLTVPSDASAGTSSSFMMTATSSNDATETATQSFVATVDQHYGVQLSVDATSKSKAPGATADFIFNVTNTGNGDDTFGIIVEGPAVWTPTASQSNITVSAVSSGQFMVSVTVPADKDAGAESGDIDVSVTSSDGETMTNQTISVSTDQVYDLAVDYSSGFDGTVTVTQETQLQMRLNITNNGNGVDTVALSMENEPPWAELGSESIQIGRDQTISVVVTLSPNTAALSGRDYTFQVIATSEDGSETTSPDLTAQIEIKETEGEEVVTEELEEEEEGGLPGFGVFASLLALTFIVLTRRKD